MKHFRNFLLFVLVLFAGVLFVNAKTDVFYNITSYVPALEDHRIAANMIKDASKAMSDITSSIPSPSEIIAAIKGEELPIDPEDVAHNAYIADSPMLTFYPHENISVTVDETGTAVSVFGIISDASKQHLIINFSDASAEQLDQTGISVSSDGTFNKTVAIPDTAHSNLEMTVFTGPKAYGQFTSWVLDLIHLERGENGAWSIKQSPVYEANKAMYEKDKSISAALKPTPSIQSDDSSIISIAQQLTAGCANDYDKAAALHDWVCSYIYYDEDSLSLDDTVPYYAAEVVANRKAVCLGLATLYAALCRSIGLPCNVVSGYALGIGGDTEWNDTNIISDYQNHAWNEVYADGRWIIVDTTWDSQNKIKNGQFVEGESVSHLYFDSNLQYFSQTHKILEYSKRR